MSITLIISYLIAIAVPAFAIYMIFALDLFGTGKGSTVLLALAWGALGAFGLAYLINSFLVPYVGFDVLTTRLAPFIEETLKALVLIYFVRQPRFRYIVDGAVYGFATGIGFAVSENLLYLSGPAAGGNATLVLAISRVLSSSLMHATASAIVGISLGHLRRSRNSSKLVWSLGGIGIAIALHLIFNNLLVRLDGITLLLAAIGIGVGGGVVIAFQINRGISEEKKHFKETLDYHVGVSTGERIAVQQLGENGMESILQELAGFFGEDKIDAIRRLLVIQANMGILENNLASPVSPRLRKAWEDEIAQLRHETDGIRNELGVYVMSFLRGVFPPEESAPSSAFTQGMAVSDPTVVHAFDIFTTASKLAQTLTPERLEATAELLKAIEFFHDVSAADLENLSRAITPRGYTPGQIIFNEGQPGDSMYLIEEGYIDLYTHVDGEERLLRTCRAGEVVGELALLDGQPRSAQARAGEGLKALMLRRDQFMMFLRSRPLVILAVLQFLAKRVRYVTEIVETSIAWASNVAHGNYAEARAVGALAPSAGSVNSGAFRAESLHAALWDTAAADASLRLTGAFSMITSALEQRERTLQKKFHDSGQFQFEIVNLPDNEKAVMDFIIQDPMNSMLGVTIEQLQAKLPGIAGLSEIVADLVKNTWLIGLGNPPHMHYKANVTHKHNRSAAHHEGAKPSDAL